MHLCIMLYTYWTPLQDTSRPNSSSPSEPYPTLHHASGSISLFLNSEKCPISSFITAKYPKPSASGSFIYHFSGSQLNVQVSSLEELIDLRHSSSDSFANLPWATFGQPLWFIAALTNMLVPCARLGFEWRLRSLEITTARVKVKAHEEMLLRLQWR